MLSSSELIHWWDVYCDVGLMFMLHFLDRRDSLKRATQINLVDVAEPDDGEPREMVIS